MKIREARQVYIQQQNTLFEQKRTLDKKLQDEGNDMSDEERGVILELSNKVSEAYDNTHAFLENLTMQSALMHDAASAKQQCDAMEEAVDDMAKCMETARRIAHGDQVPASDEMRLMKYNFEMYMSAKNLAVLNAGKSDESHESLWDEDEKTLDEDISDIDEKIDNSEVSVATPGIVEFEIPE